MKRCSICQRKMEEKDLGNNAIPVNTGRCCTKCDYEIVIPARLRMLGKEVPEDFGQSLQSAVEEARLKYGFEIGGDKAK